jgi:GTP cyclohydrolase II
MFNAPQASETTCDTVQPIEFNCTSSARIPTAEGDFSLRYYRNNLDDKEHLALVFGDVTGGENVLVRVHSECFTGDVLGSLRCDCGPQLHSAMRAIAENGRGVIIYLRQEGRGIGLEQKLRAYNLQDEGYDTVDANLLLGHQADERNYLPAAYIVHDLKLQSIRLLTNNPAKIEGLRALGINIIDRVPVVTPPNEQNIGYLQTKVDRMRHLLDIAPDATEKVSATEESHPQVSHAHLFAALRAQAVDHHQRTGRPLVTLSYAQSLDGCITAQSGEPFAISSSESLQWTHALRAAHDAILVGIGTVLADDPSLTVRFAQGNDPQAVVVDSHLRLPADAKVLQKHPTLWIAGTHTTPEQRSRLNGTCLNGAQILELPATAGGQVNLDALFAELGRRGVHSVMVEGGAQIITSIWRQKLAHIAVITIAPILLGGLHSVRTPLFSANGNGLHFPRLHHTQTFRAGEDTIIWGSIGE